ncbi:AAA domain-containing protein [Empedobacter brevis]
MKKQDIIQFWRDVEIFDLPDVQKDAFLIETDSILPWYREVKEPKKHYKWRYTLLFGKIEKKAILDHLNTLFKADVPNDWEEPVQGFSCFSALILDEGGQPQHDSYVLASYVLGINALERKAPLSAVSNDLEKVREDFNERYNIPEVMLEEEIEVKGEVVNWAHLQKEIKYLEQRTLWWKEDIKILLLTEEVPKDSEPNPSFMNSFYLDDLNYLSHIKENNFSTTLKQYLELKPSVKDRKDIIKHKQFLFDAIDPNQMTAGRWPSKIEYGLYTAQAGAVTTIFSNLRNNEGLQGVNGPPGTGKTTLLLDVIAEIIVDRAKIISGLGCHNVFRKGSTKIEKESGYTLHTYHLNPALLKNFGIVVASNNNAAVENISKELPLKSKIDRANFPEADYFSECSAKLIDDESWGVLAAALGNSKNRNNFRKAFWQSDKKENVIGFHDVLYNVYKDQDNDETSFHYESFEQHNDNFKSLLNDFKEFQKTASSFHQQLPVFIQNQKEKKKNKAEVVKIEKSLSQRKNEKQVLQEKEQHVKKDAERVQSILHLLIQRKPSFFFFQKLFKTKSSQKWNTEAEEIQNNLTAITKELEELKQQLRDHEKEERLLTSKQEECKNNLSKLDIFFASYRDIQNELVQKYEIERKNLYDIELYEKEPAEIHLVNPYHSPKLAKLRSDIFITALQLHRSAILTNAKQIRNNLNAYFEMTSGWIKADADITQNLWDTFFLCVPVISTTLASASRLFPNTDQQQIGWLLIDEAGQATAQSASGLIYRAKRCVIVGDPLQVEPVVTIPEKLVTKLRNEHNVPVNWSPYSVSVQQLADRVSLWGTYMKIGKTDEEIWTGFPLRTHRRCDDPMFAIANKIAYSNQMVKAVNTNATEPFIGASCWFDVNTQFTVINRHIIKEEIELLAHKIKELKNTGYDEDIYIISPFKSIALYCENMFRNEAKISCGTIHRFQGKEADIVFLVLGSDPKSSGARNWASQKPNMLNVALTRAKKRFYVIGNKKLWASCNYFDTTVKMLN